MRNGTRTDFNLGDSANWNASISFRKKPNSVLFIASYAGCPRVWKMASTLAESNFKITVLEWDRDSQLSATEKVDNIFVHRMKLRAPYGLQLIILLPVWWIYISLFLLANSFDVVQPQNLDNLFASWVWSCIRKTKIVYDIADFYADSYVPSELLTLRKIVKWLEKTLVAAADFTIIVDEARLKQMDLASSNCIVVYNSPPDKFEEFKTKLEGELSSNPSFTLFYAGIIEKDRGLTTIVEAIQDLQEVRLLVAGFGRMEKEFSDSIKNRRNIEFLGRIQSDTVLGLTFLSDCIIALYDPSLPNNIFASPNKLFEAMMCGKSIIASAGTNMADIVLREKCGLVVKYGNVNELKRAIVLLKDNRDLAMSLGRNGRNAYLKKYSWRFMEERLLRLYGLIVCLN